MKKLSLSNVMLAYVAVVAVFIFAAASAFLYHHYRTTHQYVLSSYEGLGSHLKTQFSVSVAEIQRTVSQAAYSDAVQHCVYTSVPDEYFAFRASAKNTIDLLSNNIYISGIFVISPSDRSFFSTGAAIANFRKIWGYNNIVETNKSHGFLLRETEYGNPQLWYSAPIYCDVSGHFDISKKGLVAVQCDITSLTHNLDLSADYSSVIVITYQGVVVSSNRTITIDERSMIAELGTGIKQVRTDDGNFLAMTEDLPLDEWRLVFITPTKAISSQAIRLGTGSLAAFGIFIIITAFFVAVMSVISTQPARKILEDMRALRNDTHCRNISDSSVKEFSELVDGINETLSSMHEAYAQVNESRERLFQATISQNRAKLDAYRMQINPHFLFNTLECMRSMASQYGADTVEDIVTSLSSMFRYTLKASDYVTLQEELDHLEHYVNVMNMRYPNRYRLKISLENPELTKRRICSMLLQPLAENSILHGFADSPAPHNLLVQCRTTDSDNLMIRFTDNGSGISDSSLKDIQEHLHSTNGAMRRDSIGLANIHQRLRFITMGCSGLIIRSKERYYTSVTFVMDSDISGVTDEKNSFITGDDERVADI